VRKIVFKDLVHSGLGYLVVDFDLHVMIFDRKIRGRWLFWITRNRDDESIRPDI
jgi:hypothetical protein